MAEDPNGKARRKEAERILGRPAKGPIKNCSCLWQGGRRRVGNIDCKVHKIEDRRAER